MEYTSAKRSSRGRLIPADRLGRALRVAFSGLLLAWAPIPASAQTAAQNPGAGTAAFQASKPIRIIVPFPPGGVSDALGRLISDKVTSILGPSLIVENRGGASGNIGAEAVWRAEADGHTLLMAPPHVFTVNPFIYKLTYDVSAFVPVTILVSYPNVLVTNAKVPVNTLAELIAYARANPGRLNYASQGSGTSSHLSGEMFKNLANVHMVHVPYKGTGPAVGDLVAGQVDLFFVHLASTLAHVRSGKLKVLATGGANRLPGFPELPAINEQVPGFVSETWMGLVAPPKTPPEIVSRLAAAVADAIREPAVQKRIVEMNIQPVAGTPAQMAAVIRQDVERWKPVIERAKIKVD